ncbi:citrate lyase holo-[acyl-carrier protein] synthase [Candidatus Clostridium stratigraminis]|uniref:citrate lyase holo-[acyl-carrier protein] synthase n=1 Tax=Candidatus Clostridium stratigraminis TaxID=3381661 RepID=A0ABW8T587_9CLOT
MSQYFSGEKQSLEDILEARDMRADYQQYLINKYGSTIVSYKLNIPGAIKYNPLVKEIFDEGLSAFKQKLGELLIDNVHEKILYKNSGPEYFAVFYENDKLIKKITADIEETHPLGRLYDFDILDAAGNQVSRRDLGLQPRKCLICESNAFECGRSRRHEVSELIEKIEEIAIDYFKSTKL